MDNTVLTPEESLLLISKTIEQTKKRFKEGGHIFIYWGTLTFLVFGSQLILSRLELYKYTLWPVYLFPLSTFYMIYYWRKEKKKNLPKTVIGTMLGTIGWAFGFNFMIMGFFCYDKLGDAMAPVFIILFALFILVCGLAIRFKPLIIGAVLVNLIGIGSFFIERNYHGFSLMTMAVVGLIIPGILLNVARKKEHV